MLRKMEMALWEKEILKIWCSVCSSLLVSLELGGVFCFVAQCENVTRFPPQLFFISSLSGEEGDRLTRSEPMEAIAPTTRHTAGPIKLGAEGERKWHLGCRDMSEQESVIEVYEMPKGFRVPSGFDHHAQGGKASCH